ncbi:MAG: ABC transporter, partial [Opitutae bacterium]|nr:ABC transporter [Opitutae bacterium]
HASHAIRATSLGQPTEGFDYLLLLIVGLVFFWLALHSVNRARD